MTARRPSGGGGPGIEARAEAPRCAAKAWTAPNSTAQSRPSIASMPGRGAGAFATREAPIMDERACGKEYALESACDGGLHSGFVESDGFAHGELVCSYNYGL